jgi:hypothetical protein
MCSYNTIFIEALATWHLVHVGCSVGFNVLAHALELWVIPARPLPHGLRRSRLGGFSALACVLELRAWHADRDANTEAVAWWLG